MRCWAHAPEHAIFDGAGRAQGPEPFLAHVRVELPADSRQAIEIDLPVTRWTSLNPGPQGLAQQIVEMIRTHEEHVEAVARRRDRVAEGRSVSRTPRRRDRRATRTSSPDGDVVARDDRWRSPTIRTSSMHDEPTTALDATIQCADHLSSPTSLTDDFNSAVVLITHDLGVVAEIADEIVVMYAGRGWSWAKKRQLFYDGQHPYTWGLPELDPAASTGRGSDQRIRIKGSPLPVINPRSRAAGFRRRCSASRSTACLEELRARVSARPRGSRAPRPLLALGRGEACAARRDDLRRGRLVSVDGGERPLVEVRSISSSTSRSRRA